MPRAKQQNNNNDKQINGHDHGHGHGHGHDHDHGHRLLRINPDDDPEYIKELQRPAAIKEDLTEMERRKRVQEILHSTSFCRELEQLIKQEGDNNKSDPEHLRTLQRLSELTLPHPVHQAVSLQGSLLAIADLRGNDHYSTQEKILRNKFAALFRLVDLFQWSQGLADHITLRIPSDPPELLINPFGLLYHEMTASSLIKITLDGEIRDPGSTKLGIKQSTFDLHAAIHRKRHDLRCIMHLHTPVVGAVSSMKCGLLPICEEAMSIGPIAYHDFKGALGDEEETERIVNDLGDKKVVLLRNHGFVTCGESLEETLQLASMIVKACETQVLLLRGDGAYFCGESVEEAMWTANNLIRASEHQIRAARAGFDNLIIPDASTVERGYEAARKEQNKIGQTRQKPQGDDDQRHRIIWRTGELEWEAWMRVLDGAGFRTGHVYRQPLLRARNIAQSTANQNNKDVAIPPSASSVGAVDESDVEAMTAHKMALLRKEQEKSRWLNSPNAYQKVELLETGTDQPKRITKWVQETTNNNSAIKIHSPHQFSPVGGSNSKEFKEKQRDLKENRRSGAMSAGPQSKILDGVVIYEDHHVTSFGGNKERVVTIGTASKGIIDRSFQHNAQVYRQLYSPNPFASETDENIQKYFQAIEAKSSRPNSSFIDQETVRAESPNADTVSLMEGVRQHRSMASIHEEDFNPTKLPIVRLTRETTFDSNDRPISRLVPVATSTPLRRSNDDSIGQSKIDDESSPSKSSFFSRSKSDRFPAKSIPVMINSSRTVEDEVDNGKKKKKRSFFSFGKKKK